MIRRAVRYFSASLKKIPALARVHRGAAGRARPRYVLYMTAALLGLSLQLSLVRACSPRAPRVLLYIEELLFCVQAAAAGSGMASSVAATEDDTVLWFYGSRGPGAGTGPYELRTQMLKISHDPPGLSVVKQVV